MPWHQMSSARSIRLSSWSFWASVPYCMIAGAMLLMPMMLSGAGTRARVVSSA
jgi:hypothetical protein